MRLSWIISVEGWSYCSAMTLRLAEEEAKSIRLVEK
jgi:hypothetical protein